MLASLAGCEQVAKLDELYIEPDAGPDDLDAGVSEDAGPDPHAELRDVCIKAVNDQRASSSLPPLARASVTQERCADEGAETDSAMNTLHYAAQHRSERCKRVGLGPENTCPMWRYGTGAEHASAADALVACIQRMWAQGAPPIAEAECLKDLEPGGCFAKHGEWINLASTRTKYLACGIAMSGDDMIWINQDFTAR
jgi:hypothetical protein